MPQQQRLQQKWQLDGTKASARSSRNGNWWNGDMTTNEWMSAFMIDVILMKVNCEKVFPTLLQKALPIGLATDFKRLWRNLISNIYFRKSFSLVSHTENFVAEIKWKKFHNCISPCSPSALSLAHIAPSHSHTLSPFSFFLFFSTGLMLSQDQNRLKVHTDNFPTHFTFEIHFQGAAIIPLNCLRPSIRTNSSVSKAGDL